MKNLRKNTKGQFVIIAALLIAVITLSLVASIHQINLHRQLLRYEPVEELVLGITSDLDRSLTHALSVATKQYNDTRSEQLAKTAGYEFISKWVRSILASYSHLGLEMNINETEAGLTDLSWRLEWGREIGLSQVYAKFDLNISAYNFKGWVGRSGKFVMLELFPETIQLTNDTTTLEFRIVQGRDQSIPIPNLTPSCLRIWAHVTKTTKILATNISLTYLGDGMYSVTFAPRIDEYTLGVDITVITPEDNIYVSAYSNKEASFLVTLRSQEDNSNSTNLGSVQLGEITYQLWPNGNTTSVDPGTYLLRYFMGKDYEFLNWTTTAPKINIADKYSSITSVKVEGNGTITAFYKHIIPPTVIISLDSRDWENIEHHLGSIVIGTIIYTPLPNSTIIATGDYTLRYEPYNSSYRFLWWESSGDAVPWNPYASSTTITIKGNGTVTAVYMARPPINIPDPLLVSREENSASENLGRIQLGATIYNLQSTINVTAGTYLLEYLPQNSSFTFLNWTTTGFIAVANPNSNPTTVTVSGTGTIVAFYHRITPTPPETVNLTLNSREWDDSSQNLGIISLDSTNYSLSTEIEKLSGDYAIQFIPAQNHAFLRWETTGNLIAWNSTNSVTRLRILGNGTLTAIYAFKPSTPTLKTVALVSREENLATQNLGKIQLEATVYNLNDSAIVREGIYLLEYIPADGYIFVNWTTTGSVTAGDENSSITSVTVNGDGTVEATYKAEVSQEPPLFELILDSREQGNSTLTHLGNIIFNSTTYNLTASVANLTAGNYPIEYISSNSSHVFIRWEWTGNAIPWNASANSTILTIYGNATITAVYNTEPPTTTETVIVLQSIEETSASQDLGQIQLGGTLFVLPNSTAVINGTYFLKYIPDEGYTFLNWTTTGNITIANPSSVLTSIVIDGNGTIIAFYRCVIPPQPEIAYVLLDSKEWDDSSQDSGVIRLDLTSYDLPTEIAITSGDYAVEYIVDQDHVFLRWEATGDIIPYNSTSSVTRLRILGNGTLTAIYYIKPPTVTQASVTLQSSEETSAFPNKGKTQFGDILFMLPNSMTTNVGTYFLEYVPVQGYIFLNWTTTGGITVEDPYSRATNVTVSDNGSIIAFYRGCDLLLNSRHWENLSSNLGKIKFDSNMFTLANSLTGLAAGDYSIQFIPDNSSHIFLWWEFSGNVIPFNSTSSSTTLRVLGDGTITAVYLVKPTPPAYASVTLQSQEETGASPPNLGKIQLGQTIFGLPNSTSMLTGTYFLEYTPAEGFTFVKWTTAGNIIVQDWNLSSTRVTIDGGGTITAIYRGCRVTLNSRHWANSSYNLGSIKLGTSTYTLPPNGVTLTGLAQGDYFLQYMPQNSSYVFLWWEFSGNAIPWNLTSNTTTVTIFGNGTITAVYSLVTEPPPPFVGEWSTLYVDRGRTIVPPYMWSLKSSHIPSWSSTGAWKQVVIVTSPPAPTIYLARYVNITAYLGIDPPWNAKDVTLEFGFNYSGQYYRLGMGVFNTTKDGIYRLTIDTTYGEFPGEYGVVPEGSIFILNCVVTFYKQPWGTFKLYYGPNSPSCIELF